MPGAISCAKGDIVTDSAVGVQTTGFRPLQSLTMFPYFTLIYSTLITVNIHQNFLVILLQQNLL